MATATPSRARSLRLPCRLGCVLVALLVTVGGLRLLMAAESYGQDGGWVQTAAQPAVSTLVRPDQMRPDQVSPGQMSPGQVSPGQATTRAPRQAAGVTCGGAVCGYERVAPGLRPTWRVASERAVGEQTQARWVDATAPLSAARAQAGTLHLPPDPVLPEALRIAF